MPRSSDFSSEFAAKHNSYEVVSVESCTAWHYHIVCGRLGVIGADNQRSTIRPRRRPTPLSAEPMLIPTVPPFWLHYGTRRLDFGSWRLRVSFVASLQYVVRLYLWFIRVQDQWSWKARLEISFSIDIRWLP